MSLPEFKLRTYHSVENFLVKNVHVNAFYPGRVLSSLRLLQAVLQSSHKLLDFRGLAARGLLEPTQAVDQG